MGQSNLLHEAERLIWSGKLQAAEDQLEAGLGEKVTLHRQLLTKGHVSLLRLWLSSSDGDAGACVERFEAAIASAEAFLKASMNNRTKLSAKDLEVMEFDMEDARLVIAEGTMYKAVGQVSLGQTVKGFFNCRVAFKEYEKELDRLVAEYKAERPDESDPGQLLSAMSCSALERKVAFVQKKREYVGFGAGWRFGLGFFLLYMSLAPKKLRKVLEVAGFIVDGKVGFGLLVQAVAMMQTADPNEVPIGSYFCAHALLWYLFGFSLSIFTENELQPEARDRLGNQVLSLVERDCPNSVIWAWIASTKLRLNGQFLKANRVIDDGYEVYKSQNPGIPDISQSRMAPDVQVNALLGADYTRVVDIAGKTIQAPDDERPSPILAFSTLSIAQYLQQNKAEALAAMKAGADIQSSRSMNDIETLALDRFKFFHQRQFGWVLYGEFLLSLFATEWLSPEQASLCANHVLAAIDQLEKAEEKKPKTNERTSRFFSKSLKLSLFVSSDSEPTEDELSIAYVVAASMLRVSYSEQHNQEVLVQAITLAKRALVRSYDSQWITVFANYELALLCQLLGDKAGADSYSQQAIANTRGFAAERSITNRIRRLQYRLKRNGR